MEDNVKKEELKEKVLDKAESTILEESYSMIQQEVSEIKSGVGREISVKNVESRKTVASERAHYTDTVFGEVKKKLLAFKKTEAYISYLESSIASAKEKLGEITQIYVARPDVDIVRKLAGEISVRQDLRIILGGLIAECDGLTVDYTFDKKLKQARDKFESSNITKA